ncbi:oxygenase MpaB family protein [Diaminobutyricibacter tongyongensis]|uniref:oxygenase MpaB family protein n=1 Tax=Leifsonia tongyongensis TaxID=1268043 RepID=UPI0030843520
MGRTLGVHDIVAEAVLVAGGGRAILLQIAHPAVGRGVVDHSDFAADPLGRLRSTLTFVYATVYGSPDEVAAVQRAVNRAHAPVRAASPSGDGPAYNAFDPQLQLWVAATLYDSAVTTYEGVFGPLDSESADRIYSEYSVLGTVLQVPPGLWPADRGAFAAYWAATLPTLKVTPGTRAVAQQVLHGRNLPLWLRSVMPLGRLATAGLLPVPLRVEFGLPWNRRRQRRFDRLMRLTAVVYPHLPGWLRHRPRDLLLRRLRRSITASRSARS